MYLVLSVVLNNILSDFKAFFFLNTYLWYCQKNEKPRSHYDFSIFQKTHIPI